MQCNGCKQENTAGEKFCKLCGLPLPAGISDAPVNSMICSNCQSDNCEGSFFCYRCGSYFLANEEKLSGNDIKKPESNENPQPVIKAKIIIPGRPEISLAGLPVFVERSSYDPTLPQDVLMSISRQHVLITYNNGAYYVQDYGRDGTGSTNHTRLNGIDIHHKGKQPLKDGDKIELAHQSELALVFKLD